MVPWTVGCRPTQSAATATATATATVIETVTFVPSAQIALHALWRSSSPSIIHERNERKKSGLVD